MKTHRLLLLLTLSMVLLAAAMLLPSCATTTAPDGTKTTAPDAGVVSQLGSWLQILFPPKAVPAVAPAK